MGDLRSFYINELRHDPKRLGESLLYLSDLIVRAAVEVDSHIQNSNHNFDHIHELSEVLAKYQLNDTNLTLGCSNFSFPYRCLFEAIEHDSKIKFSEYPELALNQMKLLRDKLQNVPNNPNELKGLLSFLCDFGNEILYERSRRRSLRRLVA